MSHASIRDTLRWQRDRWYLDGRPIHAGDGVVIAYPLGDEEARFESRCSGRILVVHVVVGGIDFSRELTREHGGTTVGRPPVVMPNIAHVVLKWHEEEA